MAYIRVVGEDEADGKLFDIYDEIQRNRGRVSNILRASSLDPKALRAHLDLYMATVFGKGGLSRREAELLAVVVSAANGDDYCAQHHSEALDRYAKDPAWVKTLAADPGKAKLNEREAALAHFALGLTKHPAKGQKEAVAALRSRGFTDEQILQAAQVVAYFNFANRISLGLGVELEQDGERDYHY
ncbi:MAG: peroxidase-related enzyme [Candidatus Thermoplasmatota archaeon]